VSGLFFWQHSTGKPGILTVLKGKTQQKVKVKESENKNYGFFFLNFKQFTAFKVILT
jgi:hypothetical protein